MLYVHTISKRLRVFSVNICFYQEHTCLCDSGKYHKFKNIQLIVISVQQNTYQLKPTFIESFIQQKKNVVTYLVYTCIYYRFLFGNITNRKQTPILSNLQHLIIIRTIPTNIVLVIFRTPFSTENSQ